MIDTELLAKVEALAEAEGIPRTAWIAEAARLRAESTKAIPSGINTLRANYPAAISAAKKASGGKLSHTEAECIAAEIVVAMSKNRDAA